METDLFNSHRKNFLIITSYYKEIDKRAENYYFFMQEYKNCTAEYLNKISNLLNSFTTDFINNKNEDKDNNINYNKYESNYVTDFSPLDKIIHDIYQGFKNQINEIKFFLKGIDFSLDNFSGVIKQTKLDVERYKKKYLSLNNSFLGSLSSLKKENKEIIKDIAKIEDNLIKLYFLSKKEKELNIKFIQKETEKEINNKILKIKEKEKIFLNKDSNKLNIFENYNNEMNNYGNKIKNNTFMLIKILKLSIEMFTKYFKNLFNINKEKKEQKETKETKDNDNLITNEIKIENKNQESTEYELIINKDLKTINNNTINSSLVQTKILLYNPKILKMKSMAISKEICDNLIKEGYDIKPEDMVVNEKDVFYIMKKLINFNLINKENFDIEKEKNKIIIKELVENIFINIKKNKDNNDKSIEEKLNKLFEYIKAEQDYRSYFLYVLGNQRINSNIELSNKLFDNLTNMFSFICDMILKEKDYDTENNLLILSQTFYKLDNNEKIYLSESVKNHYIFQSEEFWIEYIKFEVSLDVKNKLFTQKEMGEDILSINQNKMNKRNNEIIFSQIISANQSMLNFGLDKNKILNIINSLFIFYPKISPETKQQIMNFINI